MLNSFNEPGPKNVLCRHPSNFPASLYLQHLLVLRSKERNRTKDQLEEFEIQVGQLHVGTHFRQTVKQILNQDGGK